MKSLLLIVLSTFLSVPFALAQDASNQKPEGVLVGIGQICGVGRNKSEAMSALADKLNSPFLLLQSKYSAYTGSKYSGKYLKGPFRAIGQIIYERVSIIADYNWTACLMVQGITSEKQ